MSSQGQQGWNQLFDLLQSELHLRPGNAHINIKLVQLYCSDGRLEEAVNHCLAVEKRGALRTSLDWYSTLVHTLQVRPLPTSTHAHMHILCAVAWNHWRVV